MPPSDNNDSEPSGQRVILIDRKTVYQGYFRVDRYILRHRLFAGGMGPPISREIFERGHAAAVIPYDPATGHVALIEQFRPGVYARGVDDPWIVEIVAGVIEEGEEAANVAIREAAEEAGCHITDIVPALSFYVSPGGSSEHCQGFVGRADLSSVGGIHGLEEEGEDIRVFTLPLAAAIQAIDDGMITFLPAIALLQWLARHEGEVRARWT